MNYNSHFSSEGIRSEIAMAAARIVAEEGATYEAAKKRAAKQILGNRRIKGNVLPNNSEIEEELRNYNAIFYADTQPDRLAYLRQLALEMMLELEPFKPYLTGAVLNGTAGEHSDIHLQLFAASAKDVEIHLLNQAIDITVTESAAYHGRHASEVIHFEYAGELFHLSVFDEDDIRKMSRAADADPERADIKSLKKIINSPILKRE